MSSIRSKRGETIIEIMLTVVVILLALTSAFKIITMAFLQKRLTEEKVVAINLAREGMEAVRYIRDYNWLYYGSNRRICWNHLEDNNNNGNGDGIIDNNDKSCQEEGNDGFAEYQIGSHATTASDPGKMEYILKQDNNTHWYLTRYVNGELLDIGDWDTEVIAEKIETNNYITTSNATNKSSSFQLCEGKNSKEGLLTSCLNSDADTLPTKYFRYVRVEYKYSGPDLATDPASDYGNNPQDTADFTFPSGLSGHNYNSKGQLHNKIYVTVGVKWLTSGILQDVELVTILSDFYKRSNLDLQN